MGLTYCELCGCIEGQTKEIPDPNQVKDTLIEYMTVCAECDSNEPIQYVPEYDDSDMER